MGGATAQDPSFKTISPFPWKHHLHCSYSEMTNVLHGRDRLKKTTHVTRGRENSIALLIIKQDRVCFIETGSAV